MKQVERTYPRNLFLADKNGKYLGLSRKYQVQIGKESICLSELDIPLLKVQRAERVGSGLFLQYIDSKGLPTLIFLTTADLFGIGRKRKIAAFLAAVKASVAEARKAAPPEVVVSAQKTLPPDTCHECGARGGVPVIFGTISSVIAYSQWSTKEGVFCKKHATRYGVSALLTTGLLGWWSLRGLLVSPFYSYMNIRSLLRQSSLSKLAILGLGACAFIPGVLIVAFIVFAANSR